MLTGSSREQVPESDLADMAVGFQAQAQVSGFGFQVSGFRFQASDFGRQVCVQAVLGPRAGVEPPFPETAQLEREQVVTSRYARATVGDHRDPLVDAGLLETLAQHLWRQEVARGAQVFPAVEADSARYVTGARVKRLAATVIALRAPGVDNDVGGAEYVLDCCQRFTRPGAHLEGRHYRVLTVGDKRLSARIEATVEQRRLVAPRPQHPNEASCYYTALVVVAHDDTAVRDTKGRHSGSEVLWARKRVAPPPGIWVPRKGTLQVNENGSRNMAPIVGFPPGAAVQVPTDVGDDCAATVLFNPIPRHYWSYHDGNLHRRAEKPPISSARFKAPRGSLGAPSTCRAHRTPHPADKPYHAPSQNRRKL